MGIGRGDRVGLHGGSRCLNDSTNGDAFVRLHVPVCRQ